MADHYTSLAHTQKTTRPTTTTTAATSASRLRKLQEHVSNSRQLFGVLTLVITGAILLLLTGLTVIVTVVGLILLAPLIILFSPIWVPACIILLVFTGGFLFTCGFGLVVLAVLTWIFRYFRGLNPTGLDRVEYARNRVKDYGGGYLKVMDATQGA
ncbi:Oleosin [Sesbania bispinosa]|nr:Oleosin [Sesbania bispinosa]